MSSAVAYPPSSRAAPPARPEHRLGFALFIAVNAAMFIRPADLLPALTNWPIYEVLILLCAAASLPAIGRQLTGHALACQPITLCVIALLPAVILSHLSHFNLYGVRTTAPTYAKLMVYYLLLVGLVTNVARLRCLMFWLVVFTAIVTLLSLMDYHGMLELPPLAAERALAVDPTKPPPYPPPVIRLSAFGIFGNPNDLSRILAVGMMLCLYWLTDKRGGVFRVAWLAPLVLFGYSLQLTQSRGGFLAFLGGLGAMFAMRFGKWKTLALCLVVLPPLFALYSGRQTELSTEEGTGQQRIQLWAEGFGLLKQSPVFGIGMDQYNEAVGYVAHNSFIHCYVELGVVGGILFCSAFYLALRGLHVAGDERQTGGGEQLGRMRPYLMGMLAGYAVGMLTSTRSYAGPTYLLLGMTAAYVNMIGRRRGQPVIRLDPPLAQRLVLIGLAMLIVMYIYVRFSVRWGAVI